MEPRLYCIPAHNRLLTVNLLCNFSSINSDNDQEIIRQTIKGLVLYPSNLWKSKSEEAKSFVECNLFFLNCELALLQKIPNDRIKIIKALNHPWIKLS
jgi:hypothetical protein